MRGPVAKPFKTLGPPLQSLNHFAKISRSSRKAGFEFTRRATLIRACSNTRRICEFQRRRPAWSFASSIVASANRFQNGRISYDRSVAVRVKTSAETMPKARTANKTGSAKPRIFVEFRVSQYTSPATKRPTVELNMRLQLETASRVWQCGQSMSSEYATTRATGTVFPQCGTFEWPLFTSAISSQ
jgi:hypothetical protein